MESQTALNCLEQAVLLISVALSLLLTAWIRKGALWIGFVDRPDDRRKLHEQPIPLGGGLAVYLTVATVLGVLLLIPGRLHELLWSRCPDLPALLVASGVLMVIGLIDDYVGLPGRQKLLGQILVVLGLLLVADGLVVNRIEIMGRVIELGPFALLLTACWLLGAINALNLLDGIDGLATMVGIILSCTIALMAVLTGHMATAIVAFVMVGSLAGFFRYNFPPAKMFLGDAGSMLIGFFLGVLAIQGSLKGAGTALLSAPLAIWAIPIFDSGTAVLRRKLTGRSIFATDRAHLHHRLMQLLGNNRRVLAFVAVCCIMTSLAALIGVAVKSDLVAMIACFAIFFVLVATGIFGRTEFLLLTNRLRTFGGTFVSPTRRKQKQHGSAIVRIHGSRRWEGLWAEFVESAGTSFIREIRLEIDYSGEHETYEAFWRPAEADSEDRCWEVRLPILVANRPLAHLAVVGERNGLSPFEEIRRLLELVEPFEKELQADSDDRTMQSVPAGFSLLKGKRHATRVASPAGRRPK
ncbi:MAG: undecaprenyl/decaprenyl-phosphate alpha-N-acetylglucosaminyl 1-phosphate transferase [Candidatus Nealsonbacteria bacterium]|nr:undecaprenyl/decaprenyl-phosphate alpha-N-acetylglucosaminyl 1-phosphate transferase [Candidatus Nealsonbacteria bacterium]